MMRLTLLMVIFVSSLQAFAGICSSAPVPSVEQKQFFEIAKTSFDASEIEPYLKNKLVDVNMRDCGDSNRTVHRTALEYAISFNRKAIALRLLREPAVDINSSENNYYAPVYWAIGGNPVLKGNRVLLEAFLARPDFNINIQTEYNGYPLQHIIDAKYEPFLNLFLADSRLSPFFEEPYHYNALEFSVIREWPYAVDQLLKRSNITPRIINKALLVSTALSTPKMLNRLLAAPGSDINFLIRYPDEEITPLIYAIEFFHDHDISVQMIRTLLDVPGINVNQTVNRYGTPTTALAILKQKFGYYPEQRNRLSEAIALLESHGAK